MFLIFREYHLGTVLSMFLIFCQISGSWFYKIVLMKKKHCTQEIFSGKISSLHWEYTVTFGLKLYKNTTQTICMLFKWIATKSSRRKNKNTVKFVQKYKKDTRMMFQSFGIFYNNWTRVTLCFYVFILALCRQMPTGY